jgi:hypothetical protein
MFTIPEHFLLSAAAFERLIHLGLKRVHVPVLRVLHEHQQK